MASGITVIQRQCLAFSLPTDHCETSTDIVDGDLGVEGEVCICTSDTCNSATSKQMGLFSLGLIIVFPFVWSTIV